MTAIRRTITAPNMTPQSQPLTPKQVKNNAGGFVFEISAVQQLKRFLVLGTEGGTYYEKEQQITAKNIKVIDDLVASNPQAVLDAILWATNVAPRNEGCLYALAVLAKADRQLAKQAFPKVVRTGTHLFHFLGYLKLLNVGWGRGLRTMVAGYFQRDADQVAYSAVKYRQRDGWTQKDALRLSHATALTPAHAEVFNYITGKDVNVNVAPDVLVQAIAVSSKLIPADAVVSAAKQGDLPWEAFSDEQRTPEFWRAMLPNMPIGALVRNLSTMSRVGVLSAADTPEVQTVVAKLTDQKAIERSRIHPVQLTDAMLVYQSGGQASTHARVANKPFAPNRKVIAALETAIGLAFKSIPDTGKRTLIALDVSGSMQGGRVGGSTLLTPSMGTAIMAVQHAKDANSQFITFSCSSSRRSGWVAPKIDGVDKFGREQFTTVKQALALTDKMSQYMTGTDCALPMLYATEKGLDIDAFVVYTDNETWHGRVHPTEALRQYRIKSGINARLAVVGMTASSFSIADPNDIGMLDVVGLSSDSPQILVQFINGNI